MPPRPGIFRRIVQGIGRTLGGRTSEPPREPPTPPPRPPPREPPRIPPRGPDTPPPEPPDREAPFREIWDDSASDRVIADIHDRTGDSENEIFRHLLGPFYEVASEEPRSVQLDMWRDYIDAFVNDSPSFTKNDFFAEWDIARSSFSWEAWRDARGYGKGK